MSAEWDACGPEFKARARVRETQINALGESYVACWNFGVLTDDMEMKMIGEELHLRAISLMFESIREQREELKRVGFSHEKHGL